MNISINAEQVATELADGDKIYKSLRISQRYVDAVRDTAEWKRAYERYYKILTTNAQIK
jgi:hypothetical protein